MRSLKISLVLFALLLICIVANSLYIHRCSEQLSELTDAVAAGASTDRLEHFWRSNKRLIGLSISETYLDNVSRLIVSVKHNRAEGREDEVRKDLALISDTAESMRRYEELSIESLF